jgi:hypothetical protein
MDPTKLGVTAGGIVLVASITLLRFCGSLSLPPRPAVAAHTPSGVVPTAQQLTSRSSDIYRTYLESDANVAGVRTPTLDDMGKKLVYRSDEGRHVLEVGKPSIEIAGLRLRVERFGESFVLHVENLVASDVAYEVTSKPAPDSTACNNVQPLPFDAMVIGKDGSETRAECAWSDGIALVVTKVETLELSPLSAYYVRHVPPSVVGIDRRFVRGHRPIEKRDPCPQLVSQAVRTGLDRGEIGWRDLVDFYARHRCQTYQFPSTYRAFKSDREHSLPAIDSGD